MLKILFFSLFITISVHANIFNLSSNMEGLSSLDAISVYEDKNKKMDIHEIKELEFENKKYFKFNKGLSSSSWWLKLRVKNPTEKSIDWIIKFNYGQFDELQSWQYDAKDALLSHLSKGDHFLDASKISFDERTSFEFKTAPKAENIIYIKLAYEKTGLMETFHSLWTKEAFIEFEQLRFNILVGLMSAIAILLFYNVFIWFFLKSKEYFWYNIYLVGVMLSMLTFSQVGAYYLWHQSIYLIDIMPFIATSMLLASFILFMRAFLDTDKTLPRVDKVLKLLGILIGLALVFAFLGQRRFAIGLLHVSSFSFLLFPILGFKLWYNGYKIARGFAIASLVVSTTIMLSILRFTEVLQTSEFLYWATWFGFVVEGILLSIALADRINILEHNYISEQKRVKKTLESEVKKRTLELEIQTQKAERIARTDELTGVYNRRAFKEHGEKLIYDATRYQANFSLVLLDLDFFKNINDTYGHDAGDLVLMLFSKEVGLHLRDTDFFARIGGEEFVILFAHTTASHALEKAKMLLQKINALEILYKGTVLKVTASIGICECTHADETLYSLLAKADQALYYIKEHGRNSARIYESSSLED